MFSFRLLLLALAARSVARQSDAGSGAGARMNRPLLYYEVHESTSGPSAPALLLVHGSMTSKAQWRPNIDPLRAHFRIVLTELFGHGRSPAPADPALYHPDHYVREFDRIRAAIGVERWCLCGASVGGALTLRYALHLPQRVTAQAFTNTSSGLMDAAERRAMWDGVEERAARLVRGGRPALERAVLDPGRLARMPPAVRASLTADFTRLSVLGYANLTRYTMPQCSVRARIGRNVVPTLLVAGAREKRFAPFWDALEREMPNLEVVRCDVGHSVNIAAAERFNGAVMAFLQRHGATDR